MLAISNAELEKEPYVHDGDMIICPHCKDVHKLQSSMGSDGKRTEFLLYYICGGKSYIAAIANKLLTNKFGLKRCVN